MNRAARRATPALAVVLLLSVAACRAGSSPEPSASDPAPTATVEPTATPEPSSTPTATAEPSPSASASASPDGLTAFVVAPHAGADALFLDRDDCENLDDGYRVAFPDAWWTNTAIGDVNPCAWFSPTFYQIADPSTVPAEIAITIQRMDADFGSVEDTISRETGLVGRTQPAVRVEYEGADGGRFYVYQVQLGLTPEAGPNLLAMTGTAMAGDYELNKAVLDRIIATMELIGTIR